MTETISNKSAPKNLYLFFLTLLIITDAVLIIGHIFAYYVPKLFVIEFSQYVQDIMSSSLIDVEFGFPEFFQYIKTFWIVLFFAFLLFKLRQSIYLIWALLFAYLLLDDAIQIHETVGKILNDNLSFLGYWANDVGEILLFAFVGVIFFILITITYQFSDISAKIVTKNVGLLLGLLIFFGLFWDFIHAAIKFVPGSSLVTIIEDGGEMLVMSLICWYILNVTQYLNNIESLDFIKGFSEMRKERKALVA